MPHKPTSPPSTTPAPAALPPAGRMLALQLSALLGAAASAAAGMCVMHDCSGKAGALAWRALGPSPSSELTVLGLPGGSGSDAAGRQGDGEAVAHVIAGLQRRGLKTCVEGSRARCGALLPRAAARAAQRGACSRDRERDACVWTSILCQEAASPMHSCSPRP